MYKIAPSFFSRLRASCRFPGMFLTPSILGVYSMFPIWEQGSFVGESTPHVLRLGQGDRLRCRAVGIYDAEHAGLSRWDDARHRRWSGLDAAAGGHALPFTGFNFRSEALAASASSTCPCSSLTLAITSIISAASASNFASASRASML